MTFLPIGVTVLNVWELPLWAWRAYAIEVDRQRAEARKSK